MQNQCISYYSYARYLVHHVHKVGHIMTTRNKTCTTQTFHQMTVTIAFNVTSASTMFPPGIEHQLKIDAQAGTCTQGYRPPIEWD